MKINLPKGFKLVINYEDRYILAYNVNEDAVQPWVVWSVGLDGRPHTGRYYGKRQCAEKKFAELCFNWFVMEAGGVD